MIKKNLICFLIVIFQSAFSQKFAEKDSLKLKIFYDKHNVKTINDIENIDKLQDIINIWDDCQLLLLREPSLFPIFKPTVEELEFNINGLSPANFSLLNRKLEIQKKYLEEQELDKQIAQKNTEIQIKKNNIAKLEKETEEVKKIIKALTSGEKIIDDK